MESKNLKRGLKNRHLQMMALGSAIGTGLFYGSASTIALTGPSVMLAYLVSGIVIYFIMRMLGEMSVTQIENVHKYTSDEYDEPNHEAEALDVIMDLSRRGRVEA